MSPLQLSVWKMTLAGLSALLLNSGGAAAQQHAAFAPDAGQVPAAAESPSQAHTTLVVETSVEGIDPVVGRYVTDWLTRAVAARGYAVVASPAVRDAMNDRGMAYPPTPAKLLELTRALGAERGVFAAVWAQGGRYAFRLSIACADGEGPYGAVDEADELGLRAAVEAGLSRALPTPGEHRVMARDSDDAAAESAAGARYFDTLGPPDAPLPRHRPFRLAMLGGTSFGLTGGGFRNHGVGGRFDYRIDRETALGLYVGYQDLKGRLDRVASLLSYVQLEERVLMNDSGTIQVPLRVGVGYLVNNGLYARLSAGFGIDLGKRLDLVVELLAPTFWMTPRELVFSLDLGLEAGLKF